MRVAVILVWRPKNFPDWSGRSSPGADRVPDALAYDRAGAPFTAVHIASLLPRHWEVEVVNEMARDVDLEMDVDAVFLSAMDFCAPHARDMARRFRARGVKVIVGGLYATLNPGYYAGAADAVIVGEAEPVLGRLLHDLEANHLEPVYEAKEPADLADLPVPRWELVEKSFRVPMGYEATRGCPFTCSFCVLSAVRSPYRRRPIAHVIRDITAVPEGWSWLQRKAFGFWDNNLGADRAYFRDLCEALVPLKKMWACETSLDTITQESARFMGKAGARFVYIGLESLAQDSLTASNKRHNQVKEYRKRIGYLHDNGMIVMSIFLLGLDADTSEYLKELPDLVDAVGVDIPVFSLAAPIERTPFHQGLADSGRLLPGDILGGMDGAHLVYQPRRVSPDELELAVFECMRRAYTLRRVARRTVARFGDGMWSGIAGGTYNLFYRDFQRAVARSGMQRLRERGPWPGRATERADPAWLSAAPAAES